MTSTLAEREAALEAAERERHLVLVETAHALEQSERHVLAHDGGGLEELLVPVGEAVNAGGEDGVDRGRHLEARDRADKPILTALARESSRFNQGADALLQEQRVALGTVDQEPLEGLESRVVPEQAGHQVFRARRRQGVDPQLPVVGLAPPPMLVLGPVVDEKEDPGRWQALDQAIQECLRLRVDPVEIFEEDEERLHLALPEQEALDPVQSPLPALRRGEPIPPRILHRDVQQRQQRREYELKLAIQRQYLARHLFPHLPRVVPPLDLAIRL